MGKADMKKMISIIVPVYNAEAYLKDAIESLLNQTYTQTEIILVDDGSTDQSAAICESYAKQDKRIKVIYKENAGVSSARNAGIRNATGEYITFLDADDTLDADILEKAMQRVTGDSTIYQWGYTLVVEGKKKEDPKVGLRTGIPDITKDEIAAAIIGWTRKDIRLGSYFRAVCGKIFLTDRIKQNDIFFPEDIYIGEDAIFLLHYAEYMDRVMVVSSGGYNYYQRAGSSVHRYKEDLFEQYERQIREIMTVKNQDSPAIRKAIFAFCYVGFHALVINSRKGYRLGILDKREQYKDAEKWYRKYAYLMHQKEIDTSGMGKRIGLQYRAGRWCPFGVQYYICVLWEKLK
jgi:glycosyltransferase involved in cell wall biosynthesis